MSAPSPVVVQRQQSTRRTHSRQSSTSRPPVIVRQGPDNGPGQAIAARDPDNTRLAPNSATTPHSGGHSRHTSVSEATNGHGSEQRESSRHHHSSSTLTSRSGSRKTHITCDSGTWILGKTIGAGSMGKVKLARKADGSEQVGLMQARFLGGC